MKKVLGLLMVLSSIVAIPKQANAITRTWEVVNADGSAVRYAQTGPTVMIVAIKPCAYCVWQMM